MNLKKNLYIHLEISSRELISNLLLSIFAIKKGFRVHLGDLYSLKKILNKKKNKEGIFIAKGNIDIETHKLVKNKCEKLVSIDQEITPGFSDYYYKNIIKTRYSFLSKNFDLFFCINNKIKKNFESSLQLKKNRVIASGFPRFDLCKNEFAPIYSKDVKKLKDKYTNFYLFNSDYGVTSEKDYYLKYKFVSRFAKKKYMKDFLPKFNLHDFKNLFKFLKSLKDNKKIPTIIFRPHPAENINDWSEMKKINSNFFVDYPKNDVTPIILACDGIIHRGSTTAFQGILFKKKIAYIDLTKGLQKEKWFRKSLYKNSSLIKNSTDLKKWIKSSPKKNILKKINKLLNLEDKYSCEKIIDEINKFKIKPSVKHQQFQLYTNFEVKYKNIKLKIYDFLACFGFVKERDYFKKGATLKIDKRFSKQRVSFYIKHFRKIIKLHRQVSILKITDNLFEIELK